MTDPFESLVREFPDYDPDTLPPIPVTWVDQSWHNDACPCFNTGTGRLVWIDYADPAQRETAGITLGRFTVMADPEIHDSNDTLFESDDWNAVLTFLSK